MDIENIYKLNKKQFEKWCTFCLDNTQEMYENKDSFMNVYEREDQTYLVYVQRNEQSDINKFLINLTTIA